MRTFVLPELLVVAVALLLQPVADRQLAGAPSFVPALLALVGCFDLLCAVLLARQFLDFGDRRVLALSLAYVTSLVVLAGYAAAFPGVFGQRPPLGDNPSTAPWLWVSWHTIFPVLLGAALAPWPVRWRTVVAANRRRQLLWTTTTGCVLSGLAVVAIFVAYDKDFPVLIHGLDTSGMTRTAGPVMLPMVVGGVALAVAGAWRQSGLERWAAFAASTALGDVVLTLFSTYRYSVGWYAGRTLTVVSSAVVFVALLIEFSGVKRRLAEESERLRARTEQLSRQAAELKAANAELETFSYSVSHDLRAPLRAITGFARIMEETFAGELPPGSLAYLHKVTKNAENMGELIDALLTLSHTQRTTFSVEQLDMTALVRQCWADLASEREDRTINLVLDPLATATGDRRLICQLWMNLLQNAIKYTGGRSDALVHVFTVEEGGVTTYQVQDNGAGFNMAHADKIGQVFQRLHSSHEFSGTGIGMAIVQRIVHRHGGTVSVYGEPGNGATMGFSLWANQGSPTNPANSGSGIPSQASRIDAYAQATS